MACHRLVSRAAWLTAGLTAWAGSAAAQAPSLVDISGLAPREHEAQGFVLERPQTLEVEAVGAEPRRERNGWWWGRDDEKDTWPAAAWIIDARTRAVVWDLRNAMTDRSGNGVRSFSGSISLPAGVYQAHLASYVATSVTYRNASDVVSLSPAARRARAEYAGPYVEDGSYRKFRLEVRGVGRRATDADLSVAAGEFTASSFVSLRPAGTGGALQAGFRLDHPVDLAVYAIGELRSDGDFDYGWIMNADTRERVWRMEYAATAAGGGAHKNRLDRERIHLKAGRYVAFFASDDSHGPGDWNNVPPFDPDFWGLTLRLVNPDDRSAVHTFEWEPVPAGAAFVSLTRIGDDELRSQGFTLKRPLDLHIYALGEASGSEMVDYAWIVDATTRQRVWTMRYRETEAAGGADKNRLFDGGVSLPTGSYLVYYRSDDSHSYGHWNAAPPPESQYWGVSVFPASGRPDPDAVGPYRPSEAGVLAELIRMRDGRRSRAGFTLDQPTAIRIHALGEGVDREMVDYGWIEDAGSGRTVWEMSYGITLPAGGARKNRMFDGTITLPAGQYAVYFKTDGSHAYGDWNADPPDDPESWGITVRREK
ncbi:MAG TPA: hypothetical protein VNH46_06225 [Gemmatimonadales bacterium]|nr:hypothetical protein [Gemmatimonadales bacterium]